MIFENFSVCGLGNKKKQKVRFQESMHKVVLPNYTIRVWRTERDLNFYYKNGDIEQTIKNNSDKTAIEIIDAVCQLPAVAAIEVLSTSDGCGVVYYNDW